MPLRIPAAQRVIDLITIHAGAPAGDFTAALRKFRVQSTTQLSPIQGVWQQGEFIRIALDANRLDLAIRVATVLTRALPVPGAEATLFAGPGRSLFLDTFASPEATGVPTLQGADALLFLAYYMPLCPDLGDSLALLKQIVHAVGPQVSPLWISTILQTDDYQFYIFKFTPNFSNWFHVMRRDHTLAAAKWLLGPEQPLSVQIASIGNVNTVRALEHAPSAIHDLILNAILHTQTRAVILQVRAVVVRKWEENPETSHALDAIDQHLDMHAPGRRPARGPEHAFHMDKSQHYIMRNLTEQMSRHSTAEGGVPFDVAGLVMDYVRRDETVAAEPARSTLTPYKREEQAALRRYLADAHLAIAADQTGASDARPVPAVARPRPEEAEEEEKQRAQPHARLSARFPVVQW